MSICDRVQVSELQHSAASTPHMYLLLPPAKRDSLSTRVQDDTKTTNLSSVTLAVSLRLWVPTCPSGDYLHVVGEQIRKQPFFTIDKARASPVVSSVYRSHVPKAHTFMWLVHSTMTQKPASYFPLFLPSEESINIPMLSWISIVSLPCRWHTQKGTQVIDDT